MIGYLKGEVLHIEGNVVLLQTNGVGYELTCSAQAVNALGANGGGAVFTYLAVNDQGISLYGFNSIEEKNMFLKLITVSGVGPKMGITILSEMNLADLAVTIATSDVKGLSSVKGIGKKTAERIILELREKVTAEQTFVQAKTEEIKIEIDDDALVALMSLGFTRAECVKVLTEAKENGANSLEQMIAYSLKHIK